MTHQFNVDYCKITNDENSFRTALIRFVVSQLLIIAHYLSFFMSVWFSNAKHSFIARLSYYFFLNQNRL